MYILITDGFAHATGLWHFITSAKSSSSHGQCECTETVRNINVSIHRSPFYGNVVFHVNNSLDILKQSFYIPCYGFLRQAEQFQGNVQGRLLILVATQVVSTGCSLIYIQFASSTKSGSAMKWKVFFFLTSFSVSVQMWISAHLGLFLLPLEHNPVIFQSSYFQQFCFPLKEIYFSANNSSNVCTECFLSHLGMLTDC